MCEEEDIDIIILKSDLKNLKGQNRSVTSVTVDPRGGMGAVSASRTFLDFFRFF